MTELNNEMIQAVLQIIRTAKLDMPAPPPDQSNPGAQQTPPIYDKLVQGQQYTATVLNADVDGKALLRILGEKVLVETGMPLKQGQRLTVEVTSKNNGVQLEVKLSPTPAEVQAQFLKLVLPKQQPLSNLLNNLNEYLLNMPPAQTASPKQAQLQQQLQLLVREIISQIPTTSDLKEPQKLQQVLQNSGVFLESKLARNQVLSSDLKSNLVKIAQQLRPLIIEAQQKTTAVSAYNAAKAPVTTATTNSPATSSADVITSINAKPNPIQPTVPAGTTPAPASQPGNVNARPAGREAAATQPPPSAANAKADVNLQPNPLVNTPANAKTGDSQQAVTEVKSVTDKPVLTATQAAQKAILLGKAEPLKLIQSFTSNLLNSSAFQSVLNLLPKTELQVLIKQILLRNTTASRNIQATGTAQRLQLLAELLRSVESGVARVQTQQLASVPQDDATRQIWQLEIPIKDQKDLSGLMMRIEQDDSSADHDEAGSTWTVCLNFNIGDLGQIHSKVRLSKDVISTHFWSEQVETVKKISRHLPRLEQALQKLGLSVNHMTSSQGKPPDPVEITAIEEKLLDETA